MGTGKTLILVAEFLAATGVAVQFLLPSEVGITVHITQKVLVLPIRWVAPLLLISLAGVLSVVALFALYWRLANVPIPAGQ